MVVAWIDCIFAASGRYSFEYRLPRSREYTTRLNRLKVLSKSISTNTLLIARRHEAKRITVNFDDSQSCSCTSSYQFPCSIRPNYMRPPANTFAIPVHKQNIEWARTDDARDSVLSGHLQMVARNEYRIEIHILIDRQFFWLLLGVRTSMCAEHSLFFRMLRISIETNRVVITRLHIINPVSRQI